MRHIGFSTGWGSVGEFKIWRKEDSDENHNEAFTLGVPHNMVPGSERATAFMIGRLSHVWVHACVSKDFLTIAVITIYCACVPYQGMWWGQLLITWTNSYVCPLGVGSRTWSTLPPMSLFWNTCRKPGSSARRLRMKQLTTSCRVRKLPHNHNGFYDFTFSHFSIERVVRIVTPSLLGGSIDKSTAEYQEYKLYGILSCTTLDIPDSSPRWWMTFSSTDSTWTMMVFIQRCAAFPKYHQPTLN